RIGAGGRSLGYGLLTRLLCGLRLLLEALPRRPGTAPRVFGKVAVLRGASRGGGAHDGTGTTGEVTQGGVGFGHADEPNGCGGTAGASHTGQHSQARGSSGEAARRCSWDSCRQAAAAEASLVFGRRTQLTACCLVVGAHSDTRHHRGHKRAEALAFVEA